MISIIFGKSTLENNVKRDNVTPYANESMRSRVTMSAYWIKQIANLEELCQVLSYTKTSKTPPSNLRIPAGYQRVEIFTAGKIRFSGKEYRRGTILWHTEGDRLNYFSNPDFLFSCVALVFRVNSGERSCPRVSTWDDNSPLSIEDFFLECRNMYGNEKIDHSLFMLYAFFTLMRQTRLENAEASDCRFSVPMKRIMRMFHYEDPSSLSLKRISENVNISISHIHHLFKTELNISPHRYIMKHRIRHACTLLLSNCPIKDISERCGFLHVESFYRSFLKEMRMSPGDYRKRNYHIVT